MSTPEGWGDNSVPSPSHQGSQNPPRHTSAVLPSSPLCQEGLGAHSAGQPPFLAAGQLPGSLTSAPASQPARALLFIFSAPRRYW